MAAHRSSDRRRDDLGVGGLRKRAEEPLAHSIYGRGGGVGRTLGVGEGRVPLGVPVGVAVAVGVGVPLLTVITAFGLSTRVTAMLLFRC
jgi:hypothetical protein